MKHDLTDVEIVAIGDELLSGATIDTNAAHIAVALEGIGLRVRRKSTVGDSHEAIADGVRAALARTGAVITTGGLGPTRDDMTKQAVADVFGVPLVFREDLWNALVERWKPLGKAPESNRSQAEVPEGGSVFPNPKGTAPGLAIEREGRVCIMLPGPPGELSAVLRGSALDYLAARAGAEVLRPLRRQLRTAGIAESAIADKIGGRMDDLPLDVAYLPDVIGVDIRLTSWAASSEAGAAASVSEGADRIYELLGVHIYGEETVDLAGALGDILRERSLTLSVAESCTAGLMAARLVERPGASDFFWGGAIVYENAAKQRVLGVQASTLERHGAVSEECAREMAEGAATLAGSDCSIAVTGVAGPEGGTDDKPVGTVWLAAKLGDRTLTKRRHYAGDRDQIRARAAQGGLDLLRRTILEFEET